MNEWQTYDITLIGRTVTVVANGKAFITSTVIPGITGGALDTKDGANFYLRRSPSNRILKYYRYTCQIKLSI